MINEHNPIRVNIGIPAYNEQGNIKQVLEAILRQSIVGFVLQKIYVYSDGSTDQTATLAASVDPSKIVVIDDDQRKGKNTRLNQMMQELSLDSDFIVQLDADIKLAHNSVLAELIKPLTIDRDIDLIFGVHTPLLPQTLGEQVAYLSDQIWKDMIKRSGESGVAHNAHGQIRVFSSSLAKKMTIPVGINEDIYSFYFAKANNFKVIFAPNAQVYYKLPDTVSDYIKQQSRTIAFNVNFESVIDKKVLESLGFVPLWAKIQTLAKYAFTTNPIIFAVYVFCQLYSRITSRFKKISDRWEISNSSKTFRKRLTVFDMDDLKNPHWAGGQAYAAYEIYKRLANDFDITIYSSKYPGHQDYELDGIKYKHIGLASKNSKLNNLIYVIVAPFYALFSRSNLIIENFTAPISTSFIPLFTKTPVIGVGTFFSGEQMAQKYKLPFDSIERWGISFYKYFIALTDFQYEKVKMLNPKINARIIHNGVNKPESVRASVGTGQYFLFLGRIDIYGKGLDLLLEAFARIKTKIPESLYIMGSGPDSAQLEEKLRETGLQDRVKLLGRLSGDEKNQVILNSKFIVHPSRFEAQSLSALEAFAFGKPLVCFDIEGFKWFGQEVSLKTPLFDVDAFAANIAKLSLDSDLRAKLTANINNLKILSWDDTANLYRDYIFEAIKQ